MSAPSSREGYSFSGSVAAYDLAALYARCAELRLSGRLTLEDAGRSVTVDFVGGEPVGARPPGDPLASGRWRRGSFRLVQAIPDLVGDLTTGIELGGALEPVRPLDLIQHCEDARLTADLFLDRTSGERAWVRFAHGRVEVSEVNGKPELGALWKVERWTEGRFRLVLRPLFSVDAPPPPPPLPPPKEMAPDGFDLTGSVVLLPEREEDDDLVVEPRGARPSVPARSASPPPPEHVPTVDSMAVTRQVRLPESREGFEFPSSRMWFFIAIAFFLLAVVVAILVIFALRQTPPPAGVAVLDEPATSPARPATAPPPPVAAPPTEAAPSQAEPIPPPVAEDPRVTKLVERARRALAGNHARSAAESLKAARHLAPADEAVSRYLDMARGRTGRGELLLVGKGRVLLCGLPLRSPRRLKLAAGPYQLEMGGVVREVEIHKGGRLRIHLP